MCVLLETGLVLFDMSDHCMYFCGKQQLTLTSGVLDCNSKEVLAQICLTPFSTIFQLYRGGQLYLWRKPDYPEKTTDLPQVIALTTHNFSYKSKDIWNLLYTRKDGGATSEWGNILNDWPLQSNIREE